MSEFYFDCKCIAHNGSEKVPKFYLFQDYDSADGGMCALIYIPKDMQSGFCGVRVYFAPDAVDFPDIRDGSVPPEIYKIGGAGEYTDISRTNSIILKPSGGLSGCGVLAFIDGVDVLAPAKPQNTYKFVIDYTKKQTISYGIDENKSGFSLRIIYPLIRKPVDIAVVKKKNAKPVLIADRSNADAYLKNENGERIIITLKPTGRDNNPVTVELRTENTDKYDYRLVFCDPENNEHYLLVDESEYTLEDKKRRKRALAFKRKLERTVPRCPYCNEPLVRCGKRGKTLVATCDGRVAALSANSAELKNKRTVVCKHDVFAYADGGATESSPSVVPPLKPRPIVPRSAFSLPKLNIAVAGFPNSGKSVYLASVMNMCVSDGRVVADPFILRRIAEAFGRGSAKVSEIPFNAVSVQKEGAAAEYSTAYEKKRSSAYAMDGRIKLRYVISPGGEVQASTPPGDAVRLAYNPLGFELGGLGALYFYDVPGELYKTPAGKLRSVGVADCFIAVIDGDPALGAKALENTLTSLDNLKKLAPERTDFALVPIAVVFTKHDKKLFDGPSAIKQAQIGECFDENCHVVREDMLSLIGKKRAYAGSDLERHIDCSSYELEHYLKARDKAAFERMVAEYRNIKFFTCSAIGSDDCLADPSGGTKEVLFRPRRIRVELPLVWLMYVKGMID